MRGDLSWIVELGFRRYGPPGTVLSGDSVCRRWVGSRARPAWDVGITGQDKAALGIFEAVLAMGAAFDVDPGFGEFPEAVHRTAG